MKRGYKQTEIGEIPEDWKVKSLEEISSVLKRRNTTGIDLSLTISGEHGLIDQREYFNKKVSANDLSNYYHIKNGEFAYNRSSMNGYPFGAIKRLDRYSDGVLSTLYTCFAVNESVIDSDYATCFFESKFVDEELSTLTQIGGRAHGLLNITPSQFFSILVALPPLPEQKKIAEVLSSVDKSIRATQAVIEQAKVLKQGILNRLLTKGIGHKKFKQTEIGEIPEEWEVKTLRELSTSCEYGIGASAVAWSSKLPRYLRITDIDDSGNIIHQNRASIDDGDYKSSLLNEGDLLFARTGNTVGKTYLFNKTDFTETEIVYAGYLIRFVPNHSIVIPRYLFQFTQSQLYRKWVIDKKRVGAQPNINAEEYSSLKIPLPSQHEQKVLVDKINTIDESINTNMEYLDRLLQTKSGLMQDLLSGRKRVV